MHGQKKRRKRSLDGSILVDGAQFHWTLASEPQWTSRGYQGLCISVEAVEPDRRELVLEYVYESLTKGREILKFPQRPKFSAKMIEAGIRHAIAAGWDPDSRGKSFELRLSVPQSENPEPTVIL